MQKLNKRSEKHQGTHDLSLCIAAFIFLISSTLAANAELTATTRFDPPKIALGNTSRYIVDITETSTNSMPEPEEVNSLPIPQSGGLTLRNGRISTSAQTHIINGKTNYSRTLTLTIDATAPQTGVYSVPGYVFTYKGQKVVAPLTTLEVVERGANAEPTLDELIFLKTDAPDKLYIGETTDITLKLYISDSVDISNLESFSKTANGFTVSELPESPAERIEMFNGRRYRTLNWPLTVTPISSGDQDLNFEFVLTARLPEQSGRQNRSRRRSPFGSSIFDNFFAQTERFNIYTEPNQVKVLPLPSKNKPKSFSGAIGDFNMQVYTDMDSTTVGEPIMLSVKISGTGNFDRIQGPPIQETSEWRNYAPEAAFEASNNKTNSGVKRFDYVFIPNQAGKIRLPETIFSFFDPNTKEYVELKSPGIPIQVAPSNRPLAATSSSTANTNQSTTGPTPIQPEQIQLTTEEALMTLDYRPEAANTTNEDPFKNPIFISINTVGLISLIGAFIWFIRMSKLRKDPNYKEYTQIKTELKAAISQSEKATDSDAFFNSAQTAIRLAASLKTKKLLRTASAEEVQQTLTKVGVKESDSEQVRNLMTQGDALRFSGRDNSVELPALKQELTAIVSKLSK